MNDLTKIANALRLPNISNFRVFKKVKPFVGRKTSEKKIIAACTHDCGGTCPYQVHIKNRIIKKITVYNDGRKPPLLACVKGLNYRYRVYAPDRLKYPLKRVGERGAGRFRRITWDAALDIVAEKMQHMKTHYGCESMFLAEYAGSLFGLLHATGFAGAYRLFNDFGGRTALGTLTSYQGAVVADKLAYGPTLQETGHSRSDWLNSGLIILCGSNPQEARRGTSTMYWLEKAKKKGIKIICIDPCKTRTADQLGAIWIPIRPGTDAALFNAMAYHLILDNSYDAEYVDKNVHGFDEYKAYLFGVDDKVVKDAAWAEHITGVPKETILDLVSKYVAVKIAGKHVALVQGWAPGRTANGEQYHRAALTLQAITGNIGVSGGYTGCVGHRTGGGKDKPALLPLGLKELFSQAADNPLAFKGKGVEISCGQWADAILRGKKGGYPSDIRMIFVSGHNILNQRANVNKGVQALKKVDFIVCNEQVLTPTAQYADIVLPATTCLEREDIILPQDDGRYLIYAKKCVDPMWSTKNDRDIARELAKRLNLATFAQEENKEDAELLWEILETSFLKDEISFDQLRRKGLVRLEKEGGSTVVPFCEEIKNIEKNRFATPSGKIEIYATLLDYMNFDVAAISSVIPKFQKIPKLPKFVDCEELPHREKAKTYPLQLTAPHPPFRVHSQFYTIPRLRRLYESSVWINPQDAMDRSIEQGDSVRVFNELGAILVTANITDRMMQGVLRCYEGAWFEPSDDGLDRGGCVNVLFNDDLTSPGGASNCNSALVQIQKWGGDNHA